MTTRIVYHMLTTSGKLKLKKKAANGDIVDVDNDVDAVVEADKLKKKYKYDKVRVVKTVTETMDV